MSYLLRRQDVLRKTEDNRFVWSPIVREIYQFSTHAAAAKTVAEIKVTDKESQISIIRLKNKRYGVVRIKKKQWTDVNTQKDNGELW